MAGLHPKGIDTIYENREYKYDRMRQGENPLEETVFSLLSLDGPPDKG